MRDTQADDEFLQLAVQNYLQNSPDLIFFKDTHLLYKGASAAFARMAGRSAAEELVGKSDFEIFDEELARRYTEDDRRVLDSGAPIVDHVEPLPDINGKKGYSSTSKYLIRDAAGRVAGLYGVGRDVTAQVELEEERERREQSRRLFEEVLEADVTEDTMLRVDGSHWMKSIGITGEKTFTEVVRVFAESLIHPDGVAAFRDCFDRERLLARYDGGEEALTVTSRLRRDGEAYRWTEFSSRLYYSRVSNTLRIITFMKDLDDEVREQESLKHKAETDALTGLLNRESTLEQMAACLARAEPGELHALLFIDLDCFKDINDTMGHPFGDTVLRGVAEKLKSFFRRDDIVGRVGGDEFLVLLRHVSSRKDVENRAKRLFDTLPGIRMETTGDVRVTSSVGVALYEDGKTVAQLYQEADEAMYRAKKAGKNTLVFYR